MEPFVIIIIILFFSTLVRSTFGFGDALIAMPLLAMVLSMQIVTPLVALIAFTIAIYIVIQDFKKIEFQNIWKLIVSSIIGIPIGLIYLKGINEDIIKLVLGILISVFGLYNLFKPDLIKIKHSLWAYIFGFLAGLIGAAYNTNGPIIVIYGAMKKWNPLEFRATLQGYFLTTGVFVILGHLIAGNFTKIVMKYYLMTFPVFLGAIILGSFLNKRINKESFVKYIYLLLIIIGVSLIVKTVFI